MLKASVLSQLGYSDEAKANYNNVAETIEKFLSTPPMQITIKKYLSTHHTFLLMNKTELKYRVMPSRKTIPVTNI